jgi:hypothetical protein
MPDQVLIQANKDTFLGRDSLPPLALMLIPVVAPWIPMPVPAAFVEKFWFEHSLSPLPDAALPV